MKKTSKGKAKKADTQYEEFLAIKQKEQQAAEMESALMEQAQAEIGGFDNYEAEEAPVVSQATFGVIPPMPMPVPGWDDLEGIPEQPPTQKFRTKKASAPVKQPHRTQRSSLTYADPEPGSYSGISSSSSSRGMGYGGIRNGKIRTTANYQQFGIMEPSAVTEDIKTEVLPEMEASEAKMPSDIEQFDEVRSALRLIRSPERTLVYCIVVDRQNEKNVVAGLRCYGGVAFGGYARDISGDAYLVECVQAVHLGSIPFSFRLEMPKAGKWNVEIPIPEKVLEAAFAPAQRKTLFDLRERFPEERYEFQYLQMLMAN